MAIWTTLRNVCHDNCGVRINAAVTALIPALDVARNTWPTLHEYLPHNVYGVGFIALSLINIVLHIRIVPSITATVVSIHQLDTPP